MRSTLVFAATFVAATSLAASAFAEGPTPAGSNPATPATATATTTTTAGTTGEPDPSLTANADPNQKPATKDTVLYQTRGPNRFFLYTGIITLAGTYTTTVVIAANDGSIRDKDLYIPIVGPWINLASRSGTSAGDAVLIAGSGVLQGAGALMFVSSLFMKEKFATATIAAGPVTITPAASLGGVGAVGTF